MFRIFSQPSIRTDILPKYSFGCPRNWKKFNLRVEKNYCYLTRIVSRTVSNANFGYKYGAPGYDFSVSLFFFDGQQTVIVATVFTGSSTHKYNYAIWHSWVLICPKQSKKSKSIIKPDKGVEKIEKRARTNLDFS